MAMSTLELHVLGDLEVLRDGEILPLPPSRKTRALLAYLALNERSLRREQLCEMLWEIPDDPRGSLRWSLSKIRKLVDGPEIARVIADRNTVNFDTSGMDIDIRILQATAAANLDEVTTENLRQVAGHYRGEFLEGLELPDFHDFYTWCIGERERAARCQATLLKALLARLEKEPEQALDHANQWVTLAPFDQEARTALIRLLLRLDRRPEAEQQYRLGRQKLEESGAEDTGLLSRALHGSRSNRPVTKDPPDEAASLRSSGQDQLLVGREQELDVIASAIEALPTSESARVILVRGESGMGKSRLLQAAAAMARHLGANLLKASAFESETIRPFAVWNDALRRALPDNATSALLSSGERVSRDQVFQSLSEQVSQATESGPLVVLFDDVQWCDESSASAMHYVMRMNRRQPLLVISAARETEMRENTAVQQVRNSLRNEGVLQEVKLQPMSFEQISELIQRAAPQADARRLAEASAGNPLLAIELAKAEMDGGNANSLAELAMNRMMRLDEDAQSVLQWAAVLTPRVHSDSLQAVTGLSRETVDVALEAIADQGILHPDEWGLRFTHDLIIKSIYGQIPPARRQLMHRRVAELLEEATALDLQLAADLAHHAARGGDPALAGRAMVSAGKLCLRFYANDDALELYKRGMEWAERLDDSQRVCLLLQLADIRFSAAPLEDWESSSRECVRLAEQALDYGELAHARLGYQMASYLRWMHGKWSDARRDSLQAERVTRNASDEAHILGMGEAAKCLAMLERDLSQADAMAMEANALASRNALQCPAIPISLGILRYYEGRLDEALDHLEDARTICKTRGERFDEYLANEYLTIVEIERENFPAALQHADTLVEIGSRLREGSEYPFALAIQALCNYGLRGESAYLEGHLVAVRQADAKQRLAYLLNRVAMLEINRGAHQQALRRSEEALQLARLMERPTEILLAYINVASILLIINQLKAEPHLKTIVELSRGAVATWARERAERLLASTR
jgi:DNA-binding SARP family transcriptional activator/endonuclease III-like uncharacterized protein